MWLNTFKSNFVIGKGQDKKIVYIVDFGLAKHHLQNGISTVGLNLILGVPIPKR